MEMVSLVPKGGQWASPGTMSFLLAFSNYSWSQLNSLGSRHWDGDRTAENLCKKKKKKRRKSDCTSRAVRLGCRSCGPDAIFARLWAAPERGPCGGEALNWEEVARPLQFSLARHCPSENCALGSETVGWPPTSDWILYREGIWARQFYFIHTFTVSSGRRVPLFCSFHFRSLPWW